VRLAVASIAAAAVVVVVGATFVVSDRGSDAEPARALRPRAGAPPLVLDLGVRGDREAVALRRAATLYDRGRRRAAGRIFARLPSVDAQVGAALARWPQGTLAALEALSRTHRRSALVRLNLGIARFWLRDRRGAEAEWRAATEVQPDSASALRAEDLLYPGYAHGRPVFVPSFATPAGLARLAPQEQLAAFARAARRGAAHDRILYGVALQRLGRPISAERQYVLAAKAAPHDAEARVAAAVGSFDKADPSRAFSRLGPLVRVFPHQPTVRFHLGLLLLWIGRVAPARVELRRAHAEAPRSLLGREAKRFLARLERIRTG
jgi:tetratricopeptide (TPR) repeat protein